MKLYNLKKSILVTCLVAACISTILSFNIKGGEEPIAANTKITHGSTSGVAAKKEFNAGEEIYVYIPLKKALGDKPFIRLESDGKDLFSHDLITYKSEVGLTYYSFALAIDPKNHYGEKYFYKEGNYAWVLKYLSKLEPGKHKITFGIADCFTCAYLDKISITINVTAEGAQKWATWASELEAIDKEYGEKLDQ